MASYKPVEEALSMGASPRMLCETCPWDRNCITPPEMSRSEVDAQMVEARKEDEQAMRENRNEMPIRSLLTSLLVGQASQQALVCPVLAMRLKTSDGRLIIDGLKETMVTLGRKEDAESKS